MKKLAIEGHKTRGNEVIELLEMLGGKNFQRLNGALSKCYYIIDNQSISVCMSVKDDYVVYTLEEFKEKFPYKVGDEVIAYAEGCLAHFTIQDIRWNNKLNKIEYKICSSWYDTSLMQPYKEETITIDDFKSNTKEWLIDKLQSMSKENTLQTISNLYDELHKPKYPKTYKECCKVLEIQSDWHLTFELDNTATDDLYVNKEFDYVCKLEAFRKLLICRDAYWKIAGEEMGLGKSWNPDFTNNDEERYGIYTAANKVERDFCGVGDVNTVLTFPIEKMRDAFYENFKDLIEQCKELL